MERLTATRIASAHRRGSSRPVVAETERGVRLLKLRGAAQGTAPLVAEVIVGELARAVGLHVPGRAVVQLPPGIETAAWDDELASLLASSVGENLGFDYLEGAREITGSEAATVPRETRARILWFDRLVMNPDRTAGNTNLLTERGRLWLIDHGAALGFQYDWAMLTEDLPRRPAAMPDPHVFEDGLAEDDLTHADALLAPLVTREQLDAAVAAVPDSFLGVTGDAGRRRAAYSAFLWKRLRPPRAHLTEFHPRTPRRVRPPAWLTRDR